METSEGEAQHAAWSWAWREYEGLFVETVGSRNGFQNQGEMVLMSACENHKNGKPCHCFSWNDCLLTTHEKVDGIKTHDLVVFPKKLLRD